VETSRPGPIGSLTDLLGSFAGHFQLLGALFAQEGKEAGKRVLWALVCLVAALLFAVLGYLFLVLGLAFALAALLHWSWIWIALGIGALHAAGAFVLVRLMLQFLQKPVFPHLRAEIHKDLAQLQPTPPVHEQNPVA